MAYRIYRKIECIGFRCRILAGKKGDHLSDVISSHKFETEKCGGCPLCFGFKSSSYYTLGKISETSLTVLLFTSNEHSTSLGKYNHVQLLRCKSLVDGNIQVSTPFHIKLNLVSDKVLARDVITAMNKFIMPEMKPIGIQENNSWISWGKDMIFSPFYCSPESTYAMITDKIDSKDFNIAVAAPSFLIKIRIHKVQELKTLKYAFLGENFCCDSSINYSESSEGSSPRTYDIKNTGNIKNMHISCDEKHNCSLFSMNSLNFNSTTTGLDYEIKKISAKAINKGQKSAKDSLNLERATGSITFSPEIQIKLNTDPLALDVPLEDMHLLLSSIYEMKSFYFRMMYPQTKDASDVVSSLFLNEQKKGNNHNKDKIIEELKEHTSVLAVQLEEKIQECNLLRKTLCEVAGNSGIAGILNIDADEIICISEKGKIDGIDVNLVLTKEIMYVVTKEGRILNRNLNCDMVALEEKGSNELSIKMKEGKFIKSTLNNKNEFVRAIKEIFRLGCA